MNNNIATLLTNVYEIEGLLLVVTRHGKDTPSLVYQRIQKAAHELNEQCKLLTPDGKPVAAPQPTAAPQVAKPEPKPEPQPEVKPEPVVVEQPVAPAPVTTEEPVATCPAPAETHAEEPVNTQPEVEEPKVVPVEDREPDEDIDFEFIYEEEPANSEEEEMEQSKQDDEDMPASPFSFSSNEAAMQALKEDDNTEFVVTPPSEQAHKQEPVEENDTYDKPAKRDPAKDLRKSFSINDYYRFRRELFQGDETAMNSALDLIQEMRTASDVEYYFIKELDWDAESEDVKDFMEIVRNHFA